MFEYLATWLGRIQSQYGVNPIVFAVLYFSCVIPFWFSLYKIVTGLKNRNFLQVRIFTVIFSITIIAPFVYVALFGHNLPVWFWLIAICLIAYGVLSAVRKIKTVRERHDPDLTRKRK